MKTANVRDVISSRWVAQTNFERWRDQWEQQFFAPVGQEAVVIQAAAVMDALSQGALQLIVKRKGEQ